MLLSNNIEKNKTTIKPPLSIIGLNFFLKIILYLKNKKTPPPRHSSFI